MAKARQAHFIPHQRNARTSFAKTMCSQVAYALLIHTFMLIMITSHALETSGISIFPYFLLVFFVGIAIPYLRALDRKWQNIDTTDDRELSKQFTNDRIGLWSLAIAMPIVYFAIAKAIASLFG